MAAQEDLDEGLLALVDANAWTFGPISTSLRLLRLSLEQGLDPRSSWPGLYRGCLRLNPLACWARMLADGALLASELEADLRRRESLLIERCLTLLRPARRVLLVGQDHDLELLLQTDGTGRSYRHLLLEGPLGVPKPGSEQSMSGGLMRPLESPLRFGLLEEGLDWADTVLLSGFPMHRCNLLGPAQLRPLLMSARDQVDRVVVLMPSERDVSLGTGAPVGYTDHFRPCWWNHAVTHLLTDSEAPVQPPLMQGQHFAPAS